MTPSAPVAGLRAHSEAADANRLSESQLSTLLAQHQPDGTRTAELIRGLTYLINECCSSRWYKQAEQLGPAYEGLVDAVERLATNNHHDPLRYIRGKIIRAIRDARMNDKVSIKPPRQTNHNRRKRGLEPIERKERQPLTKDTMPKMMPTPEPAAKMTREETYCAVAQTPLQKTVANYLNDGYSHVDIALMLTTDQQPVSRHQIDRIVSILRRNAVARLTRDGVSEADISRLLGVRRKQVDRILATIGKAA